jgi:hypothetical protein
MDGARLHLEAPHGRSPLASATTPAVYVTVTTLDDPLDRAPEAHVSVEEKVGWLHLGDGLPQHRAKTAARMPPDRALWVLYVADQAAATAFWRAVLGVAPRLDVPGMTEFTLPSGEALGLMPEAGILDRSRGSSLITSPLLRPS